MAGAARCNACSLMPSPALQSRHRRLDDYVELLPDETRVLCATIPNDMVIDAVLVRGWNVSELLKLVQSAAFRSEPTVETRQ